MGYKEIYNEWLTNAYFDADTKAELERIASDENEIKERFYTDLEFGTAGRSGNYRSRNEPYEYLYSEKGNTGTGKLYFKEWKRRKRSCHRI